MTPISTIVVYQTESGAYVANFDAVAMHGESAPFSTLGALLDYVAQKLVEHQRRHAPADASPLDLRAEVFAGLDRMCLPDRGPGERP